MHDRTNNNINLPMNNFIYLDNNSTTKIDDRVLEEMMPFLTTEYGNASSPHRFGSLTNKKIGFARELVADLIGASPSEITFTAGATESLNLAIVGFALANQGKGRHIVTAKTEHKAVLACCSYLETIGFEVSYLPVDEDGTVSSHVIRNALTESTILVIIMLVNNETGVLQNLDEIIEIAHGRNVNVICDATQAVGKIRVDVNKMQVDMLILSGHKFYGPKGIGALYIRKKTLGPIVIFPVIHGGGQEYGLRGGTSNVPGIIGLGKASELAVSEMEMDEAKILPLRNFLENQLLAIPGSFINGIAALRIYNTTNITFLNVEASVLVGRLGNIAISNGSACISNAIEPSHVLTAMGLQSEIAFSSIRISLGKYNTAQEIELAVLYIKQIVSELTI